MADINDMFDEAVNEISEFIPLEKDNKFKRVEPGEYKCRVIECNSRIVDVRNQWKARVYNYSVEVVRPNHDHIGKKFKGYGIFKFLEPTEKDEFESNASQNWRYANFCKALGVECKVVKRKMEIKGKSKEVEVKQLPVLDEKAIVDKLVIAVVGKGKPYENKGRS